MVNALLLGKRKALGEEILTAYTHAGVIHLLALSGLHVGLLVLILMYLLKPLVKLKFGKSIRFGILLFFLWSFAFFVGLGPSVVRSVTLFSFIVIGNYINQGKHSFHYTMLSFFVLLICYPPFLRSIGFQLSYLAVFGILAIRPLFLQLWNPSPILYKRFWELITVSLSAQIAVSPISIYYFHQFPSLFLLSNLIILPFFGLFLSFSLVVLLLLIIGYSFPNIFQFYEIWVTFLNQIVFWIAQQETFLFDRIYNSTVSTLLTYAIILSGLLFFYRKAFSRGVVFLIFSLLFISNLVMETKKEETVNCFWIFHQHKESVMGHQKGRYLYYSSTDEENSNRILTDFITSRRLKNKKTLSIKNSYKQRDFKLLLLKKNTPLKSNNLPQPIYCYKIMSK
ncbi:ComEC/Rec2 family competence protein [Flavobacteriaceae bacterium]|nr:ComEC/Rec2 family competence protein [Flavobacteriaceae bacterium]